MSNTLWLHEPLDYWKQTRPTAELVSFDGATFTYEDGVALIDRMAGGLARELIPGQRFAILSRNSVEMLFLYFAASKAGVVPVGLNYRLTASELEFIVADCGATLLFAQDEYIDAVEQLRGQCPELHTTITLDGSGAGTWRSLAGWLGEPIVPAVSRSRRCDEAMQIYTSGTTGRPKGAVLTHVGLSNLLHQWRMCYPSSKEERLLVVAPLYHVGGTFHSFHAIGHGGAVFLYADFDAVEVVRALDEERIRTAFLVPAMLQSCLEVSGVDDRSFESFTLLSYGGSAISEPVLRRALRTFGCEFVQSFGMTEMPCITYLTGEDHERALADAPGLLSSTGRIGPGSQMKIVDEVGAEVEVGEVGEILGRGPQIMQGYWNLAEATAEALEGGWMHTGDAGFVDAEGYLYVKDRIKDMIVSGAENVYPREVENVLLSHGAVIDAAVVGIPSDRWGETVKAFVVVRGSEVTPEELVEFCVGKLAGYKRPRTVEIIDELPRNPSGKVLKRVLREPYWAGLTRQV